MPFVGQRVVVKVVQREPEGEFGHVPGALINLGSNQLEVKSVSFGTEDLMASVAGQIGC